MIHTIHSKCNHGNVNCTAVSVNLKKIGFMRYVYRFFLCFYDFAVRFSNCSDGIVCSVLRLTNEILLGFINYDSSLI